MVVLGERISGPLNRRAHALSEAVRAELLPADGWGDPVPAYASLLVPFEPDRLADSDARARLAAIVARVGRMPLPQDLAEDVVEIPVRYGGQDGPDLDEVAEELSLRPAEVVAIHVAVTYRVFLLGFAPGFAYLGTVSPRLALPRRATPRSQVPPGSVAIAGAQTAVYPFAMPGGWHLLGRTDVRLWDATADRPSRLVPGDRVRFVAVAN
jgi:KipI family sensor histidine kinase inhibitor